MINIFSRHFPPPIYGGAQSFFYNFLQNIDDEFTFYTHKNAHLDGINKNIIRLPFVPPPRKPNSGFILYFSTLKTFIYFIKKRKTLYKEGIHFGQIWPYGIAALLLKKIFGIKYTIFLFGEEVSQVVYSTSLKYKIIQWFYRVILKNSSSIQVSSSFVFENLKTLFSNNHPNTIRIFYNGLEPNLFCNVSRKAHESFKPRKEDVIIFSISRHIERKGYKYLFDSVKMLETKTKNWHLFIGGDGPESHRLKLTIDNLGLNSKVTLLGELNKEELHFCYNKSDIFILTNIWMENGDADGCPIVFLEAACYSTPSLGGNVPGTKDAVIHGETGYIVNSKSPSDVSDKLEKLINDTKLRTEMGNNAYLYVNKNYKWTSRIKDFRRINEKILN